MFTKKKKKKRKRDYLTPHKRRGDRFVAKVGETRERRMAMEREERKRNREGDGKNRFVVLPVLFCNALILYYSSIFLDFYAVSLCLFLAYILM